ncbi:MAG: hypothetical protein RL732_205, partial [Bacteroidota bacterium]
MPQHNIAILGAGMVGRTMALDLASAHTITSFDISEENLNVLKTRDPRIKTERRDLMDFPAYTQFLKPFDLVINAVPGFMGFRSLQAIIAAQKNCADISFFPENPLDLQELAVRNKVIVITDCGVAPGMSNLILGRMNSETKVEAFECYVGGIPRYPQPPFFYKAPFSPIDVIEEYVRPCKMVKGGKLVVKEALSEREFLRFPGIDVELEAFNTDGLRTLVHTMKHIPDIKEKTLRYKGHIDIIVALKESGFFSEKPLTVKGSTIVPLAFTSQLLLDQWKLGPEEEEITVMKVVVREGGKVHSWDMIDFFDAKTKLS